MNATASGYYGFTKEMSFARLVLSTASVNDMLVPSNSPLPPRDFATHLARDFIRKVSTLYPVLSETAVFGSLEAVYQHKGLYCSPWDRWVVRMVLAIALLLRSQLKGDSDYKNAVLHACAALEQREAIIQPGSMAAIQAILLLVIYSLLDPSHFNSWYLVGVASRIMVDIGLHQEPPEEIRMKSSQLELRRRIFYCLYSLDRLVCSAALGDNRDLTSSRAISISHVRALSFTDDSVHVEHPSVSNTPSLTYGAFSSSQYGPPDQAIQPSLDLINFRQVQSPLYHALFGSNRDLLDDPWYRRCDTLHTLKAAIMNIPDATPEEVKQMFNADLHYTSILFVKPPGGKEIICSYGTALLFEYSIGYAQSMWLMYHHSQGSTFCTNLDLIRTMFVAQELLDLLREFRTTLMTSTRPTPPAVDPGVVLPQLQPRSSHEVLAKAIDALTQLDQIIDILGRKFGYPSAYNKFKRESTVILQNLYANDVSSF